MSILISLLFQALGGLLCVAAVAFPCIVQNISNLRNAQILKCRVSTLLENKTQQESQRCVDVAITNRAGTLVDKSRRGPFEVPRIRPVVLREKK